MRRFLGRRQDPPKIECPRQRRWKARKRDARLGAPTAELRQLACCPPCVGCTPFSKVGTNGQTLLVATVYRHERIRQTKHEEIAVFAERIFI
jgi:hypothetical protein